MTGVCQVDDTTAQIPCLTNARSRASRHPRRAVERQLAGRRALDEQHVDGSRRRRGSSRRRARRRRRRRSAARRRAAPPCCARAPAPRRASRPAPRCAATRSVPPPAAARHHVDLRRTVVGEHEADLAERARAVEVERRREARGAVRRAREPDARCVAGGREPRDGDALAVGRDGGAVHGATFDVPAVDAGRDGVCQAPVDVAAHDDVANLLGRPVAIRDDGSRARHRSIGLAAIADELVDDLARNDAAGVVELRRLASSCRAACRARRTTTRRVAGRRARTRRSRRSTRTARRSRARPPRCRR